MPRHLEKKIVPYTQTQLFDLVADVARYPEFLPWCHRATVERCDDHEMKAELVVGHRTIHDSFTSRVTLRRPRSIEVAYEAGPMAHLVNHWTFNPHPGGRCEIVFFLDFAFRSKLLGVMMDVFFDRAFVRMMQAFEARAAQLYGEPT